MVLPEGILNIGLPDERRSRSRALEETPGSIVKAERLKGDPQYLIRAMAAEGNRLAGLLRAHRLLPAAGRVQTRAEDRLPVHSAAPRMEAADIGRRRRPRRRPKPHLRRPEDLVAIASIARRG